MNLPSRDVLPLIRDMKVGESKTIPWTSWVHSSAKCLRMKFITQVVKKGETITVTRVE